MIACYPTKPRLRSNVFGSGYTVVALVNRTTSRRRVLLPHLPAGGRNVNERADAHARRNRPVRAADLAALTFLISCGQLSWRVLVRDCCGRGVDWRAVRWKCVNRSNTYAGSPPGCRAGSRAVSHDGASLALGPISATRFVRSLVSGLWATPVLVHALGP